MTTLEQARAAKDKLKAQLPETTIGISQEGEDYVLRVALLEAPAPNTIPAEVDGVKVMTEVVPMPTIQVVEATPWFADKQVYLTTLDKFAVQPAKKAYQKLSGLFKKD